MRIVAHTVPAGETFMTRFPTIEDGPDNAFKNGRFDEGEARAQLAGYDNLGFITWGNDDRSVVAFAYEFLSHLTSVTRHIEADEKTTAHTSTQNEADRRLERRMDRGRYAYTRFEIKRRGGKVIVRVSCANPKDIPGAAIASARRFGVYACRILLNIQREINSRGVAAVELEGVGDMADIFDEARWTDERMLERDRVDTANAKRTKCPSNVGGYCSPSDPDCPCYHAGKCEIAHLPEKYLSYRRAGE